MSDPDATTPETPPVASSPRRRGTTVALRLTVGAAVVGILVLVVRDQGGGLRHELGRISIASAVAALVLGLAAVGMSLLSWRAALASVGARLPLVACVEVFLPSQLGKYLPGSVWPVLAQAQLGQRYGIPRSRMATGSLLALGLSILVASVIGGALLPVLAGDSGTGLAVSVVLVVAVVVGLVVLHPRVLGPVLDRLLRVLRREPVGRPEGRQIAWSVLASASAWLLFGLHAAVLARGLGGHGSTPLVALVGLPLASAAGILVVIAPAGAGVRETVLVLLLRGRLGTDGATALVLLSRGLLAVADLLAAVAGTVTRVARRNRNAGVLPTGTGAPARTP